MQQKNSILRLFAHKTRKVGSSTLLHRFDTAGVYRSQQHIAHKHSPKQGKKKAYCSPLNRTLYVTFATLARVGSRLTAHGSRLTTVPQATRSRLHGQIAATLGKKRCTLSEAVYNKRLDFSGVGVRAVSILR
ncbi:hypothetical protein DCF83_16520 [Edwardsiella tarda]|uniref:hypothetical protein n=1 Tax=Edwardsiella tarda TaxID=636 RepID=UPI0011B283A6|nr:hypothetical protein [Edwardsiella tarda]UCQ27571.1 hypothetical protein DCF83_16520 [Edwardsiella tarda]